jgi:hypothetical protein
MGSGAAEQASDAGQRLSRSLTVGALALLLFLLVPSASRADTAFGGDPNQAITPDLSCQAGAFPFSGAQTCMWNWNNPAVGTDIVPIPVTGGSGTITSVTLPAMPNPGPMEVVVLTAGLSASTNPAQPDFICCQVKQVGPEFTVSANQVTTVAQSLHVSATEEANLSMPGDTSFGDLLGISVLSPTASLPVRYTGNTSVTNFDGAYAYFPAPAGANGEFVTPTDPAGYQLLARFTLALDGEGGGAGGGGGGGGGGEPAAGGLKLRKKVGANGRTVTLGRAANPPTARTTQTLLAPAGARAAAARAKRPKRIVYGSAKTSIPSGKSVALKVKLNGKGRAALKRKGRLKATLRVVASNAQGETQTVTRTVTIKRAGKRAKKK